MKKQEESDKIAELKNVITITDKGIEVYNNTILERMKYFDEIVISSVARYLPLAYEVIQRWVSVGIFFPDTKGNKIIWTIKEEDLYNRELDKYYKFPVNKITLIKNPALFSFTNPKEEKEESK